MKTFSMSVLFGGLMVAMLAKIALPSGVQEQQVRSTADGVFTQRQAKRGQRVHRRACQRCHIPDFYKGGLFDNWAGNTVGALHSHIANTMPQDRPSSLTSKQYTDILAFLLMINEFPPGEDELPSDDPALARIIIKRSKK